MEATTSHIANVAILNEKFKRETWYNTFWSKFAGFVDISQDENGNRKLTPSGKPIEILNSFIAEGRDNMLIPFLMQLTGDPVYGDTVLKGTGEAQSLKWLRVYVNQWRKAVEAKSGSMSDQRLKIYKLYEKAKPQLIQWFSKWENQMVFQTFYEGASGNVTAGTDYDGIGLVKRYHPNWYMNDGGTLTAVGGTEKTNKTTDNLDDATGDCDTGITTGLLEQLRIKAMELKIPQMMTKNGNPYWVMIIHPKQAKALRADEEYKDALREAYSAAKDTPELMGTIGYYAGFMIFEDIVGIRSWDDTDSTLAKDGWLALPDGGSDSNYNAIVVGDSAIGKGIAENLHFTEEIDDHNNVKEIGGALINGYNRADFAEDGSDEEAIFLKSEESGGVAAATSVINQSSLILMTKEE